MLHCSVAGRNNNEWFEWRAWGYCHRKKGVKDNTEVFVLSNWVQDGCHVLVWGSLGKD